MAGQINIEYKKADAGIVDSQTMLEDPDENVKAAAKSRDGAISIEVSCKGDLPGFKEKACLGSLSFLRGALNSAQMDDGGANLPD